MHKQQLKLHPAHECGRVWATC